MRLSDVTAVPLSSPVEPMQLRPFHSGYLQLQKRDLVLLRVETADGEVGHAPAPLWQSAAEDWFEDEPAREYADLFETGVADAVRSGGFDSPEDIGATVRNLDLSPGLKSEVRAALDVAYYDIRGKRAGAPVYELLADREVDPDPIELEGSSGLFLDPAGYGTQASALRVRGFETYTFRTAGPPDDDLDSLRKIRDRTDEELGIVADAHIWWKLGPDAYDEQQVANLLGEMATYNPDRVQEPLEPTDTEAYERLLAKTDVPIAAGLSAATPTVLRDLLETGVDYLMGDVCRHGGFTGCWDLVESCVERDIPLLPHSFGTRLETIANAHLATAAPGEVHLEYPAFGRGVADAHPFPLADDILTTDLDVSQGMLTMPEEPGLGVEVDESVLDEYPYIEGSPTEYVLTKFDETDAY